MVGGGGRRRATARMGEEGGPARPGVKGKVYLREEEEQLCRSVLHVSQDRVAGNQQRSGVFWERIATHYDEHRPGGARPQRSLETKWGTVKHDVSKFIGVYSQVIKVCRSGSNSAYILKRSHELYRQKSAKNTDFAYEHCWVLLKDHPRWADGWTHVNPPTPKRTIRGESSQDFEVMDRDETLELPRGDGEEVHHGERSEGGLESQEGRISASDVGRQFRIRPGGTKAAKEEQFRLSKRENAMREQAQATKEIAEAQKMKARGIIEQNLLLLMTTNELTLTSVEAREFLHLRRVEELDKLRNRLALNANTARGVEQERQGEQERELQRQQEFDRELLWQMAEQPHVGVQVEQRGAEQHRTEQRHGINVGRSTGGGSSVDCSSMGGEQHEVHHDNLGLEGGEFGLSHNFSFPRGYTPQTAERGTNWDDIDHVDPEQPCTWTMAGGSSRDDTIHLDSQTSTCDEFPSNVDVGLSLHGHRY